jgi:hypothetical protein
VITFFFTRCVFQASVTDKKTGLLTEGNTSLMSCTFTGHSTAVNVEYWPNRNEYMIALRICETTFLGCGTGVNVQGDTIAFANCYFGEITGTGLYQQGSLSNLKIANCYLDVTGGSGLSINAMSLVSADFKTSSLNAKTILIYLYGGSFKANETVCFKGDKADALSIEGLSPTPILSDEQFNQKDCLLRFQVGEDSVCDELTFFYPSPSQVPPIDGPDIVTTTISEENLKPESPVFAASIVREISIPLFEKSLVLKRSRDLKVSESFTVSERFLVTDQFLSKRVKGTGVLTSFSIDETVIIVSSKSLDLSERFLDSRLFVETELISSDDFKATGFDVSSSIDHTIIIVSSESLDLPELFLPSFLFTGTELIPSHHYEATGVVA